MIFNIKQNLLMYSYIHIYNVYIYIYYYIHTRLICLHFISLTDFVDDGLALPKKKVKKAYSTGSATLLFV